MELVGRRVEVLWPPENDETEGGWYSGRVDRYDELTGYHVIYDDGDEEDFVEMEDRDDIHILPDSCCVSQRKKSTCDDRESATPLYKPRLDDQASNAQLAPAASSSLADKRRGSDSHDPDPVLDIPSFERPAEIPRAETTSCVDSERGSTNGISPSRSSEYFSSAFPADCSNQFPVQKPCLVRNLEGSSEQEMIHSNNFPGQSGVPQENKIGSFDASANGRYNLDLQAEHDGGYLVARNECEVEIASSTHVVAERGCGHDKSHDSPRYMGYDHPEIVDLRGDKCNGEHGSLEEDLHAFLDQRSFEKSNRANNDDSDGQGGASGGFLGRPNDFGITIHPSRTLSDSGRDDPSNHRALSNEFSEGTSERPSLPGSPIGDDENQSLPDDSTEWTPLKGSRLLDSGSEESQGQEASLGEGKIDEDTRTTFSSGTSEDPNVENMVSALRTAPDASTPASRRHMVHQRQQNGCALAQNRPRGHEGHELIVGQFQGRGHSGHTGENRLNGWEALGELVGPIALLSGAIEGLEGVQGGTSGVLVKVSFVEGVSDCGTSVSVNTMFRCKRLLHTARIRAMSTGEGLWEGNDFQCEVAVPLGLLLEHLEPSTESSSAKTSPGNGAKGEHSGSEDEGLAGGNNGVVDEWNSLRSWMSGKFQLTDRSGRASAFTEEQAHRQLQLAISIVLPLRKGDTLPGLVGDCNSHQGCARGPKTPQGEKGPCSPWTAVRHKVSSALAGVTGPLVGYTRVFNAPQDKVTGRIVEPLWKPLSTPLSKQAFEEGDGSTGIIATTDALEECYDSKRERIYGGRPGPDECGHIDVAGGAAKHSKARNATSSKGRRPVHEAPSSLRRRRRQEEIAHENERLNRRLRDIAEARVSRDKTGGGRRRQNTKPLSSKHEQGRRRPQQQREKRGRKTHQHQVGSPYPYAQDVSGLEGERGKSDSSANLTSMHSGSIHSSRLAEGPEDSTRSKAEADTDIPMVANIQLEQRSYKEKHGRSEIRKDGPEGVWRELYKERDALALEVEAAAREMSGVRSRVETLRAKTLWTEANARRASLTVSALRKALELRGVAQGSSGSHLFPCSRPRVFNPAATVAERKRGAGSGVPDEANFFSQGDDSQEGLDKDLVEELRERRDLYKVLLENRRRIVVKGELLRQQREEDLKALDTANAQLEEAELRQRRHLDQHQHHRNWPWTKIQGKAGEMCLGRIQEDCSATPGGTESIDRVRDLVTSLRVEVETLKLAGATAGANDNRGEPRVAQEAKEEVARLKGRLAEHRMRLESAISERNAARAEYQNCVDGDRQAILKESIAWLERAKLISPLTIISREFS